ncbi:TfoX/Sxy family protein [Marinimicrobium agarilyticum]|uniref:TfoX/Sxy family protein n=1 Tax=Marinimicrobium agarilyticum TaxID=306546 RepID=UPI0003F6F41C|nr:TfoX/Sxy family protein [Marinimicrobium agarilyticum]
MSVSHHALSRALHHLSEVAPVSYRRIFTGVGLYHQHQLFAVMANDRLYFRVDEDSVQPYRQRSMPMLHPRVAALSDCHFYQLPEAVLEDSAELIYWMRAAVEASQSPTLPASAAPAEQTPTLRYHTAG